MAIVIDKKIYRNIQEQVEKNKRDIAAWSNIQFTLNNFGITVLGRVDAEADIPEGTYSYGEAYLVGTEEPYDIYIFTRDGEDGSFINMGPLSIVGPQGAKGDQGDAGTITVGSVAAGEPGTNPIITNSGTAQNAILNFVIPRGLTGATGAQGNVGPKGETGERGPIGLTGPQGDPGESFMIIGTITNTSQLPDPTETPRNYAYVLKDGDQTTPDLIYFITGAVGSEVWSYASFAQTGTTVSVNGNPVSTFDADTKLDKTTGITTYPQLYAKSASGNKVMIDLRSDVVEGEDVAVSRSLLGNILVPLTPVSNNSATSKKYVDDGVNARYTKPSGGIPASDLASAVQTSLEKADSAVQPNALQATTLWTNQNPTSAMSQNTITTSNMSSYIAIIVEYKLYYGAGQTTLFQKVAFSSEKDFALSCCAGGANEDLRVYRSFQFTSATSIEIRNCYANSSIDNNRLIPIAIYGTNIL